MGNKNGCCEGSQDLRGSEIIVSSSRMVHPVAGVQGGPGLEPIQEITEPQKDRSFSEDESADLEEELRKKLEKKKQANKKKMGISAEAYGQFNKAKDFKPPVVPKAREQEDQIRRTLQRSFMFNGLEEREQQIVIEAMQIKKYVPGEFVITQGDQGNELYIVAEGSLRCEKIFPGKAEATFLKTYGAGEVFGELSLLYNTPRGASIISVDNSVLFSLDRETFNHIVKSSVINKREKYENFLKNVEILKGLDDYDRSKLCDVLRTETFRKGDYIIRQGDEADKFYILQEGTVETYKSVNGEPEKLVYVFKENDYFGELALIKDDKRQASCKVASEKAVVASLDKDSFKRLLGGIQETIQEKTKRYNAPKAK